MWIEMHSLMAPDSDGVKEKTEEEEGEDEDEDEDKNDIVEGRNALVPSGDLGSDKTESHGKVHVCVCVGHWSLENPKTMPKFIVYLVILDPR